MKLLIIHESALSNIDKLNLKECSREHYPVTVVTVDNNGYSKRYKLQEIVAEVYIHNIDLKYIIII